MPLVYRSMKGDAADGLPLVGTESKVLGVRLPPDPNADVDLDAAGNVQLNGQGMSVASGWRLMLPHLIPKRLKPLAAKASGSNGLTCYRMGDGLFSPGVLTDDLALELKSNSPDHGNVVPAKSVIVSDFLAHLAATRALWIKDEA